VVPTTETTGPWSEGPAADEPVTAGEVSGTDDARVLAELGGLNLRERPVTASGQRSLEPSPRRIKQQVTCFRYATADHEAGRIKDRGQVGEPLAQPAAHDLEAAKRGRVAFGRGLGYLRAGNTLGPPPAQLQQPHGAFRGAPCEFARLVNQGVPAAVLLPAAAVPAAAQPAVGDHADMPGLARHAPPATVELTADDDARADACSHRHKHHVAVSAGGPEPRLGPGRCVRVVLHHHLAAQTLLDPLLQRLVTPGEIRREQHRGPGAVDEPGCAEPDGCDLTGRDLVAVQQFRHHIGYGLLGPRRARRRSRPLQPGEDPAVFVDHSRRDLRATDVNADG